MMVKVNPNKMKGAVQNEAPTVKDGPAAAYGAEQDPFVVSDNASIVKGSAVNGGNNILSSSFGLSANQSNNLPSLIW